VGKCLTILIAPPRFNMVVEVKVTRRRRCVILPTVYLVSVHYRWAVRAEFLLRALLLVFTPHRGLTLYIFERYTGFYGRCRHIICTYSKLSLFTPHRRTETAPRTTELLYIYIYVYIYYIIYAILRIPKCA